MRLADNTEIMARMEELRAEIEALKVENEVLKQLSAVTDENHMLACQEIGDADAEIERLKAAHDQWKLRAEMLATALKAYSEGNLTPVATDALAEYNKWKATK